MDVALLAKTRFLHEEPISFRDLVVGLIDEQVRVTQVLPDAEAERLASSFGALATWRESAWRPVDRRRVVKLTSSFGKSPPDVVHALDGGTWSAATAWASKLGAASVLSVWSVEDVVLAPRLGRRLDPTRCVFTAATEPLRRETALQLDPAFRVELVPPGIHVGSEPAEPPADRAPSLVVSGDGKVDAYVTRLFDGLRQVVEELPDIQVVVDTSGEPQRNLWRHVESLGLLGHVSFVPMRLDRRDLLMRSDAFVQPQPLGRARSLVLQAMASARPILAQRDPAVDYLIDGKTAAVVDLPDADTWSRRLVEWARSPSRRDALGRSARRWVAEHRVASATVDRLLGIYRALSGEAMPFPGTPAAGAAEA